MDKEQLWKRFLAHMGYTDAEMALFRSDPVKVKMVTESPQFVKSRIVAEVIGPYNCHAGHKAGQRIVMDGNGQLITRECPEKMCIFERTAVVQGNDIGPDKAGWGKIVMKVSVEPFR